MLPKVCVQTIEDVDFQHGAHVDCQNKVTITVQYLHRSLPRGHSFSKTRSFWSVWVALDD